MAASNHPHPTGPKTTVTLHQLPMLPSCSAALIPTIVAARAPQVACPAPKQVAPVPCCPRQRAPTVSGFAIRGRTPCVYRRRRAVLAMPVVRVARAGCFARQAAVTAPALMATNFVIQRVGPTPHVSLTTLAASEMPRRVRRDCSARPAVSNASVRSDNGSAARRAFRTTPAAPATQSHAG